MNSPDTSLPTQFQIDRLSPTTMRLITNPEALQDPKHEHADEITHTATAIREYLFSVLKGNSTGPFCPFVKSVEAGNGYYVITNSDHPNQMLKTSALSKEPGRLSKVFKLFSPSPTHEGQPFDPTVVIEAFTNPEAAMDAGFCRKIDGVRNHFRSQLLRQGLMLSQMHPFHPRSASAGYVAPVPMLVVRRMHAPDHVFMNRPEEKNIYRRFFPNIEIPV